MDGTLILLLILLAILILTVVMLLLVLQGNLVAMKFLAKNGVAVFSGNIMRDYELLKFVNPDGIGWIRVPNSAYAPVMKFSSGKYKDHNFLGKENAHGEIYLIENDNLGKLQQFANKSENTFKDLCMISGSSQGNANNLRKANLSQLKRYSSLVAKKPNTEVILIDNGKERKFKLLCTLDMGIEDFHGIQVSSRKNFLNIIQSMSGIPPVKVTNDIIILRCKTDIDNLMLFLVEVL